MLPELSEQMNIDIPAQSKFFSADFPRREDAFITLVRTFDNGCQTVNVLEEEVARSKADFDLEYAGPKSAILGVDAEVCVVSTDYICLDL